MIGTANDIVLFLMNAGDRDKKWEIEEYKEKRSLSQNSYYWVLVGKIAKKSGVSATEIHNRNLRNLGLVMLFNEKIIPVYIPDTDEAERQALESDTVHMKPTGQVKEGKDGIMRRCYVMLRGSSTFDVEEMTALLNLAVQDAKALGIETLTPNELLHMKELEKQREERTEKR